MRRTKQTLRDTVALTDVSNAVRIELAAQEWSMEQEDFRQRVQALRDRIGARR